MPGAPHQAQVERPPRVVVVDDHVLFRSGLVRLLLDEGIDVVGEADSGSEALHLVAATSPSVVLLDLSLPDLPGVEVARKLILSNPRLQVVVLTLIDGESDVVEAIVAGASGYLLKDASVEDIIDAIAAAAHGESTIAPALVSKLVRRVRSAGSVVQVPKDLHLNKRELDVLRLLADGRENREIAALLFISPSTVKHHVSSIIAKLGVGNRIQAAVRALQDGLL
jgi:DNA-binding NarL/FixJ family response regulator